MDLDFILSFVGLFMFLAGFIIGLGAVTVIDLHGFLGRKSSYWSEATVRTHKITKPLIWIGINLSIFGSFLFYINELSSIIPAYHLILFSVLVANGGFLSLKVSPYLLKREKEGKASEILPKDWQNKIFASFVLSFLGWWISLGLLVYYLLENREIIFYVF